MFPRILLVIAVLILFWNNALTGAPKSDDAKNIQGTWRVVSWHGLPDDVAMKARVKFSATQISVFVLGEEASFNHRLNATKKPKEIEWTEELFMEAGKDKLKKVTQQVLGIYELVGDDLKLCIGESYRGKDAKNVRPTEFKAGKDATLIILKRDK